MDHPDLWHVVMKRTVTSALRLLPATVIAVLVLCAGCASSKKTEQPPPATASAGGEIHTKAVYVLVDGRQKATIPATVRVKRGMGARIVSLYQSGKEIRKYELETIRTSGSMQLEYSFFGEEDANTAVFDAATLPKAGKDNFIVPYSPYRITVEDHQYQFTLIVEE
jgi:hypothetical protein